MGKKRAAVCGFLIAGTLLAGALRPAAAFGSSLVVIQGRGWGNGVGMSQWGAEGYAQHGWGYQGILAHYYPHTTLVDAPEQSVRVLLAQARESVAVGSAQPFLLVDARGVTVHVTGRSLRLTSRLRVNGQALAPPIAVEPGAQPVTFDGAGYRGSLVVRRSASGLSVVNTVPLERYLRGVVPSEMPTQWSEAAYRAQAVAARSYALASLRPTAAFDVYADNRSQVYGGIRAETPETNLAVGATAGEVLTYDARVIRAFYDSDSGGRTAAVQDVFFGQPAEPYLVSVTDPFDALSPYRHWRVALSSTELSQRFAAPVADVRVELNRSGRANSVRLVTGQTAQTLSAADFSSTLGLRSTFFTVGVASLTSASDRIGAGRPLVLRGFLRGLVDVVLQERTGSGDWQRVRHVVASPSGRFVETLRPLVTTDYRLAVDQTAGPAIEVAVGRLLR